MVVMRERRSKRSGCAEMCVQHSDLAPHLMPVSWEHVQCDESFKDLNAQPRR